MTSMKLLAGLVILALATRITAAEDLVAEPVQQIIEVEEPQPEQSEGHENVSARKVRQFGFGGPEFGGPGFGRPGFGGPGFGFYPGFYPGFGGGYGGGYGGGFGRTRIITRTRYVNRGGYGGGYGGGFFG